MDNVSAAVAAYAHVLYEATQPGVKIWNVDFLERCSAWCLYIEAELMAMSHDAASACRLRALEACNVSVPHVRDLKDALHQLYKVLLQNEHSNDAIIHFIMNHYEFLNQPGVRTKEALIEDVGCAAQRAAANRVLSAIHDILLSND